MTARDDFPEGRFPPEDRQVAQLRIPPHSTEAECGVLGALLLSASAWDIVGDLLLETDFYRYQNRLIFTAVAGLANAFKPIDTITVYDSLKASGHAEEAGGLPYLTELAQYVPSAGNIRRHAEIVREKSILRRLVSTSDEIATEAFSLHGKALEALLEESVQKLLALDAGVREDDWETADVGICRVLDHIQAVHDGGTKVDVISLGLKELDERLDGGGRPGEVIVIGARPSMGKSALGASIGISAAEDREPTAFWTGEMPKQQLWTRAMSMRSHIHLSRLKRPERLRDFDWPNLTKGVEILRQVPFMVNDTPGLTITKLRSKLRAAKRKHGLRVAVVDHLGLMEPTDPKAPRHQQVGEITRGLKRIAKELGILIILLVQLNRALTQRADPTPQLSDLRESGDIEQDADVVLFLHRPIYYKPNLGDEWKQYAEIIVAKLRDGSTGTVPCMFIGENVRLQDWPEDTPIPSNHVQTKRDGSSGGFE